MYIAINGQLGSGKSEVCKILKRDYGFESFSTGIIQRQYAKELGISTLELNERAKNDFSYDYEIDKKLVEYADLNRDKNIIFDSRMAWHFVKNSYMVHLLVNPSAAAERVFYNRKSDVEVLKSVEDTLEELIARRRSESERYKLVYGVSMTDYNNYDLILDTTTLNPEEVTQIIIDGMKEYARGNKEKKIVVSPQNVYPTEKISCLSEVKVKEYISEIKDGKKLNPIKVIKVDDALYICDGHHRIVAMNACGIKKTECVLLAQDGECLPDGTIASDYITVKLSDIYDWESTNNFNYGFYPKRIMVNG
ncbi:MAG: AAA family ATPase [Clostridia bacterium]|nr:AAA family ATPase [Clostridia bacterium]